MPCSMLAAVLIACMGVPDTSKTVIVPRRCAALLSRVDQDAAKACAAERGVRWQLEPRRRRWASKR